MSNENANNSQKQARTSLYLVRRAEALLDALRFFSGTHNNVTRRRLQFLAQSDFWEWEIDNLIYSFTNLAERRETWRSPTATTQKLGQLGIAIDSRQLHRATWRNTPSGRAGRQWKMAETARRIAPVQLLAEVIAIWNDVVTLVEAQFVTPMRAKVERWNVQTRKDLGSLRKTMPTLEEIDE